MRGFGEWIKCKLSGSGKSDPTISSAARAERIERKTRPPIWNSPREAESGATCEHQFGLITQRSRGARAEIDHQRADSPGDQDHA